MNSCSLILMLLSEWMTSSMWYIYTVDLYSAIKENEIMAFASQWMEMENIMLSKTARLRKHRVECCLSYMEVGEKQEKEGMGRDIIKM